MSTNEVLTFVVVVIVVGGDRFLGRGLRFLRLLRLNGGRTRRGSWPLPGAGGFHLTRPTNGVGVGVGHARAPIVFDLLLLIGFPRSS